MISTQLYEKVKMFIFKHTGVLHNILGSFLKSTGHLILMKIWVLIKSLCSFLEWCYFFAEFFLTKLLSFKVIYSVCNTEETQISIFPIYYM